MTKPKEEKKPLDMTTEEAINFVFPKEAVEVLNTAANPEKKEVVECDEDSNGYSYDNNTA